MPFKCRYDHVMPINNVSYDRVMPIDNVRAFHYAT